MKLPLYKVGWFLRGNGSARISFSVGVFVSRKSLKF